MIKNYFKTAWRNLQRNKLYAAINIFGMAIGLAAFWMIALYVSDELSYDRSFANSDRVYRVVQHASWEGGKLNMVPTSAPFAPGLKNEFPEVEDAARIDLEGGGVIKYGDKTFKQNDICFADNSLFKLFDYQFMYGSAPTAISQPNTIVITQTLAKKIFGDESKALNQTISFGDDNPVNITGVIKDMPANSHLQFSGIRSLGNAVDKDGWQNFYLYTYLLLKKGADVRSLEKKLPAFAAKTVAKEMGVKDYQMELQPLSSIHLHSDLDYEISSNGSISRVYMFIVIGILILLIALINYMNLSTARAAMRVKEIGIRKVIGSAKKHLAALFISEALLVSMIAVAIGFFIVQLCLPFFNELAGKNLDILYFGTAKTIAAVLILALLIGVISGIYPSFFLSRFKMIPSLKGQLGNMHTSNLFRKSLVVFQFVIAVCLISGSFIIYKQLQYVSKKDLGFNKEQLLTFHIDDMKVRSQVPALKHALMQNRIIEGVTVAGNTIGTNSLGGNGYHFEKNGVMQTNSQMAKKIFVDEDFLSATDMKLAQGRAFSKEMQTDKYGAVIINETLMKELGYTNATGKRMGYYINKDTQMSYRTIIGVVKDFHSYSLQHKIEPMVMMMPPAESEQDNLYVKIAKGKAAEGIAHIKKVYASFDKNNTAEFHFLDENFNRQYAAEQRQEKLSLSFTILAFIIACLGLFGLVTFATAQRRKEIGIRKVLGASVSSVTLMLSKDFGKLVAIATIIAVPIAWFAMNKWLQEFAYRIDIQWWMFLLSGIVAILIALITVSSQAIKAALTDPVKNLRTE
jgi:putative ABC transport system permease protein